MGRLGDLYRDETWIMVILDCITPCFRDASTRIARDFRVEREEIRSAMTAAALEVWVATAQGVPPRHVRDRMVKAAFDAAFRLAKTGTSEHRTDDTDVIPQPDLAIQGFELRTSSVIMVNDIRDPAVAEQIRGERLGALFQRMGLFESVRAFHEELRAGRRSGSVNLTVNASRLSRHRFSNPNLYYYTSDLYPSFIGLPEAADVMRITESAAHRLIRKGQFPFAVARAGRSYKVSVKALMHFAGIPDVIVHADDVENGALHASGSARKDTPL